MFPPIILITNIVIINSKYLVIELMCLLVIISFSNNDDISFGIFAYVLVKTDIIFEQYKPKYIPTTLIMPINKSDNESALHFIDLLHPNIMVCTCLKNKLFSEIVPKQSIASFSTNIINKIITTLLNILFKISNIILFLEKHLQNNPPPFYVV